jgi:hypothetical protein
MKPGWCRVAPWSHVFGEEFERSEDMLLRKVREEAGDQLEALETEFGVEDGPSRCSYRTRFAG